MESGDTPRQIIKPGMPPAPREKFVETEVARWGNIARAAGIAEYV